MSKPTPCRLCLGRNKYQNSMGLTVDCPQCKDSRDHAEYLKAKKIVDEYELKSGIKEQKDQILRDTISEHLEQNETKKRGRPRKHEVDS